MSDKLSEFKKRAELAEQQLKLLEQRIIMLEQLNTNTINIVDDDMKNDDGKIDAFKDVDESKLPFKSIKDEMFKINEMNSNVSMNVTVCNGELSPPFISSKGIKWLMNNFEANKYDIFVDTYAKSGTTLMIKLVYQILKENNTIPHGCQANKMSSPWEAVPWTEVNVSQELYGSNDGSKPKNFIKFIEDSSQNNSYRLWKTHAPLINMPINNMDNTKSKIIHVIRNPKDVLCSYYNFFSKEPFVQYTGNFDTLFNWFIQGTVVHSNYFDFELKWYNYYKKNPDKIFWIEFEKIIQNPKESIKNISQFLNIKLKDQQIDSISNEISFAKMKNDARKSNINSGANILMNKGGYGGWINKLSTKQSNIIDRIAKTKFKNSGIQLYGMNKNDINNPITY